MIEKFILKFFIRILKKEIQYCYGGKRERNEVSINLTYAFLAYILSFLTLPDIIIFSIVNLHLFLPTHVPLFLFIFLFNLILGFLLFPEVHSCFRASFSNGLFV